MKNGRFWKIAAVLCMAAVWGSGSADAAVRVIGVTPAGATDGTDAANVITVTFDKPMVPLSRLPEGDGTGPLTISPAVKGKFRWQGTSTLSFTPSEPLVTATEYTVTVAKGFKSQVTGDALERDCTWRFQTLRPGFQYSDPRDREGWVTPDRKIVLAFNLPMDPRNVRPDGSRPAIHLYETAGNGQKRELEYIVRNAVKQDFADRYFEYKFSDTLLLLPSKPLDKGCIYTVEIDKGLPAREGNLGTGDRRAFSFKTFAGFAYLGPADGTALTPGCSLRLLFTNQVNMADLVKNLRIDPKADIAADWAEGQDIFTDCPSDAWEKGAACAAELQVKLLPGTTYHITVGGELKDRFGQKLGKDVKVSIVTTDYPPRMSMPTGIGIVERYLPKLRHPITLLNIDELLLQKTLIPVESIVSFAGGNYTDSGSPVTPPGDFAVDRIWKPGLRRNERTLLPLELKEVLGEAKSGIVYLQVSHETSLDPYAAQYQQVLLQVTGMGITGKFSPDGNLIYVSYLKNALPVKEADIELRDNGNKLLWTGKTDGNGFAVTPGWEELKIVPKERWNKPRIWVIAKKNDDLAFIHSNWGTGIYPYNFNISYDWDPACPEYEGHIFSERGIYRPGEPVYLKGIIREKRLGKWQIPRIKEYRLFIEDSRSAQVVKSTITLSDYGSFDFVYNSDRKAPTGYYTVYVWEKDAGEKKSDGDGEGYYSDRKIRLSSSFRVEEYKPATFEVLTKNDNSAYIAGDTVTVKVNGRYLTGSAMPEADMEYSARLDPGQFTPDGYDDYMFGAWDEDGGEYSSGDRTLVSGKGKLDKEGAFTFSYRLEPGRWTGGYTVVSEASVTAPDRQKLSGRASGTAHASRLYIGLKSDSSFIEKGKRFRTRIVAVDPDGRPLPGKALACALVRREWRSVRKGGTGGRWEWQTERMDVTLSSFTVQSGPKPVEWSHAPDTSGYYCFSVSGSDERGNPARSSQYFYVTGRDYCAWQREDTDRIELVCDKTKYKPGDTAKILVKSPYESANAVVTLEREGIIARWHTKVKGSADTIAVPIKRDYLPNVYVCVMLYQGRTGENKFSETEDETGERQDLCKPSFKIGYTNLPVDPEEKHLSVAVTTDKKEYRPGQQVKVKLKVLDNRNKGTPAEVDVAVSDLGILNLINYQTPNPFPYFYGPRPLSVETAETRLHIIGQRNYGEKGENRGGGGGFLPDVDPRSKFIPTAYWNPKILTDGGGHAEFSFTLPGNLSSFRVMATAHTREASFGCGDTRFAVNKPLMLKPSLPRFALAGDRFSAGVLCHNNTQADGKVRIGVEAKGIAIEGQTLKEVELKKGEVKEVTFDFRADRTGTADLVFKAAMGKETDGLQWSFPVNIPRPTEAVATCGSTLTTGKEALEIPSAIYDDASAVNLSIAPTALVGLGGGLEYLFTYPYGCCEQKTSKVLPLVLAGGFIDTFNLAPLKAHSGAEIINGYLKEVPEYQAASGGFGLWKDSRGLCSPYLTCYVTWVLSLAKAQGYAVDPAVLQKACGFLKAYLRDDKSVWEWPYGDNAALTTKAFCVYVLSLNGYHEQSYINDLFAKRDRISLLGKIYLMKALHRENMGRQQIETLSQEVMNRAKFAPTEIHFEEPADQGMYWIWHSDVRTTAAVLQGLLEVNGTFAGAEKVAKWLVAERKAGRWENTQENAYVFYAFNEYVKHYEKETPDFAAQVTLAGREILAGSFKGRTTAAKTLSLPVTGCARDVSLPLEFRKTGAGRLYYDLRMIYAPTGELQARDEGISVEKKIEPFKGTVDGNTFGLGGRYRVTLKVKSSQDRRFVVVDDPLPAGFEIVNMSFATESGAEARQFDGSLEGDGGSWWGGFDHSETYDDRLLLFANSLSRGEHTYSYLVQATTAGEFLLPPTKAEEMYTPEVFGRTGQKKVLIK